MVVQLTILVGNANDLIGLGYTRIEVYQSTDQGNSFQEITAPVISSAVFDSLPALTTFRMGGRLLKLKVDGGVEQSIEFSDLVPLWTTAQVVNRINEVVSGLASVFEDTKVRLTSTTAGRSSSVEITYSDAEDLFSAGIKYGKAARITLVNGTYIYSFPDVAGKDTDRYKWRFSANGSNPISDFSAVVSGAVAPIITAGNLSVGTARFYDSAGQPVKTKVLVGMDSSPQAIAGGTVTKGSSTRAESDNEGFLQLTLVRGIKVRIAILGTSFIREFVVPNAASFDLMAVMATAVDPFVVQTTPPQLIRRSV